MLFPDEDDSQPKRALRPFGLPRLTQQHLKILSALGLAAVIVTTWIVMRAKSVSLEEPGPTPVWSEPSLSPSATAPAQWLVHVIGAVVNPGVVTVPAGARVIDAIEAAGGLAPGADPAELNLAAPLVDGCQIIIGTVDDPRGEVRQGTGGDQPLSPDGSGGSGPLINLNTATQAQLETLPGVGPVTAQAILVWRSKNGPFTSVAQLQEVDGIGPKTFAKIEPYVTV